MTVKELIAELEQFPPSAEVVMGWGTGLYDEINTPVEYVSKEAENYLGNGEWETTQVKIS